MAAFGSLMKEILNLKVIQININLSNERPRAIAATR